MDWKQEALYDKMSDISEDHYAAGWMSGNEFNLWRMAADPTSSRNYGMCQVGDEDIQTLREISADVGGWIYWCDDETDPGLPSEEWGPRFLPMAEWLAMYDKRMAEWAALRQKYAEAAQPAGQEPTE